MFLFLFLFLFFFPFYFLSSPAPGLISFLAFSCSFSGFLILSFFLSIIYFLSISFPYFLSFSGAGSNVPFSFSCSFCFPFYSLSISFLARRRGYSALLSLFLCFLPSHVPFPVSFSFVPVYFLSISFLARRRVQRYSALLFPFSLFSSFSCSFSFSCFLCFCSCLFPVYFLSSPAPGLISFFFLMFPFPVTFFLSISLSISFLARRWGYSALLSLVLCFLPFPVSFPFFLSISFLARRRARRRG